MNLTYVYKLLVAADGQRHGFLGLRGTQADHEVRLMADAGLVDATFKDRNYRSFTVINRVTDLGHKFLRTHEEARATPAAAVVLPLTLDAKEDQSPQLAVIEKWKANFASGLPGSAQVH